ncbi:MAG: DUF885 domain-containing protein [Gemmatimonadetes bacterium]|nr:DUF885 domain-containing protein [Gemmatimonadota bacterium]
MRSAAESHAYHRHAMLRRILAPIAVLAAITSTAAAQQATANAARSSPAITALSDSLRAARRGGGPLPLPEGSDPRYRDRLGVVSLDLFERERANLERLVPYVAAIDRRAFTRADSLDLAILERQFTDRLAELRFRSYLLPLGSRSGFHFDFAGLPKSSPFETVADYDRYIARMQSWRVHVAQQAALLREGIRRGMVMPRAVLQGYDRTAGTYVVDDPGQSAFAEPLRRLPSTFSADDRARIQRDGMAAIRESVLPGFAELARFFREEYIPAGQASLAATALPDGRDFYAHRVRMYTTLDVTPEQVHETGLREVARIRSEMDAIRREVGFRGDHAAFVEFLRNDPRFTVATEAEYLALVSHAAKLMDGNLPRLFGRLPVTPYGVRAMPAHVALRQSAGYYDRGAADGTQAGWVNINTSMLASRPTWAARALAFHEGAPGHHLQIMMALENPALSQTRRNASITVFVEGWGLYAERLGVDVGLYNDPYDRFGMWSYQIWRACRLVVDTGMHALGWTRERAIAYMAEHTGMTVEAVTAEIDRHITEPGQGLAYTIGELVISELRRDAEQRRGSRFDIRAFHEAVLRNGALPLGLLREEVQRWIAAAR